MNEESLFHEVLAKPPHERLAFLREACAGNTELFESVAALLAAREGASGFMKSAAEAGATAHSSVVTDPAATDAEAAGAEEARRDATHGDSTGDADNTALVPTTVDYQPEARPNLLIAGRYTLVEKIGEGGMGEVWVAKQSEPVKRKVALKLIRPGMDSRAVIQRFEQERQALAVMDHPNIARVLDGGVTATGQPFFVMELVHGSPLNRFCDESKLTPRERLELFVPICQAVQHAHQKGIVHRDLKPANILVTLIDGKPVPKVIDFGVAKATAGKITDATLSTQFGAVVGTLEYMSPEQAGIASEDIDTRADIYSLGVILYELLTGLRPLDAKRLRQAALTEMIRIVREEVPSRPSTRLSSDQSLPSLAALRQTEPRKLLTMLRGELDWVVMKCLEKSRDRRYESANGLARDIQRYLADEAVEARPPSAGYRFGKFVRRHRLPVITASSVVGMAVLGLGAVSAVQTRARNDLDAKNLELVRANGRITQANDDLVASNSELKRQRNRAEENEQLAIDAVKQFRDAVANEPELKKTPALEELRRRLLKEPLAFFRLLRDRLEAQHDTRLEALSKLASASFDLGALTAEIGNQEDALKAYTESLAIRQKLAEAKPADTEFQSGLADSYNNVGLLLSRSDKPAEALNSYRSALAIRQELADAHPTVTTFQTNLARSHSNIGVLLSKTGKPAEGLKAFQRALAIQQQLADANPNVGPFQTDLAGSHNNIGILLSETGMPIEALKENELALEILRKLADANPSVTAFQTNLVTTYNNIGAVLNNTGKPAEAMKSYQLALEIIQRLADANPTVTEFQTALARSHINIALLLSITGKPDEALKAHGLALEIRQRLADGNPSISQFQSELALSHNAIGYLLRIAGKPVEALKSVELARDLLQKVAEANPTLTEFQTALAGTHHNIGDLLRIAGKPAEALTAYEQALGIRRKLAEANPSITAFQTDLAQSDDNIGLLLIEIGKPAEALKSYTLALEIRQKLADANPTVTTFQNDLAQSHNNIGLLLSRTGKPVEALKAYESALAIRSKLAREYPESPDFASFLGATLNNLAMLDIAAKRFDEARSRLREAITWQRKALAAHPAHPTYRQSLRNHLRNMINAASGLEDAEGVAEAERELAELQRSDPLNAELDARLSAIVKGDAGEEPTENAERLRLAQRAYDTKLHATAARLWADALASDPRLGDDRKVYHRYNAACAAVLAASGQAKDEPSPAEYERAKLRQQARTWLEAELEVWTRLFQSAKPDQRKFIAATLNHWRNVDPDLVGVREENELAKLPETEQTAWRAFWKKVDALLEKARVE
jgi:serine/threonine protein kinase/tetratricopeptide (TPR) repeat protein